MTKTLDYYNENAQSFIENTVNVEFHDMQDKFLTKLSKGSTILDFGCGSGRDTKYFISQGYTVEATDGSLELVKAASQFTGIQVKQLLFNELNENEKYDGVWACSSILHCPKDELTDVFTRIEKALKNNGLLYTSFKYGTFEGDRHGRFFTDFTEETFQQFINNYQNLKIEEQWISSDARPGRSDEKWLNLFIRKK